MLDINELFQRDPLNYSVQDLDAIIGRFREARASFFLGNQKAGSTKPKTEKQKQAATLAEKLNLDLDF